MSLLGWTYRKIKKQNPPYYFDYSIGTILAKPLRKWVANVVAANCPFNCIRIFLYRLCGFRIGRKTFIGMRCYLDDTCYNLMDIGDRVIISYGVYFTCHGRNQGHHPLVIEDDVYIGMRASIITKNEEKATIIGRGAVVGACCLVNKSIPPDATAVGVPCRILEKGEKGNG